jgi:hypothetical protein
VALFFGYYSDKLRRRFPFILTGQLLLLAGLTIEITPAPRGVKYFGIYICLAGGAAVIPGVVSWCALVLNSLGEEAAADGLTYEGWGTTWRDSVNAGSVWRCILA